MGLSLITPPADEPVLLDEVKAFCNILDNDRDAFFESLIRAARRACEAETRRSFITQTWQLELDDFPCARGPVLLPQGPVTEVSSVTYFDSGDAETELDAALFQLDLSRQIARLVPAVDEVWPTYQRQPGAVVIEYVAGYGDDASAVPEDIRIAIQMYAAWIFANREGGAMPEHVCSMLSPYRVQSLA